MEYLYGLDSMLIGSKKVGNIADEGLDWGGDEPTTVKVWAAQKRSAPVAEFLDNPGTDEITFDLIQLIPENIVQVMGGSVSEDGKRWNAPAKKLLIEDSVTIVAGDNSGEIKIKKVKIIAKPKGKLGWKEAFKIHCKMTVLTPEDESSPYSMGDAEEELVG